MTKFTNGSVRLGIPQGWKEVTIGTTGEVIGCWTIDGQNIFKTSAAILFGKTDEVQVRALLNQLTILKDTEIQVGGRPARRFDFEDKDKLKGGTGLFATQARGIGIVLKTPEADGKYLSAIFVSSVELWDKVSPLFEASLRSIDFGITKRSNTDKGTIMAIYYESGQERPLAGATVIIGRRLGLIAVAEVPSGDFGLSIHRTGPGGPIDVLRGEAIFETGTTNDKGIYTPTSFPPGEYDVVVWKKNYIPAVRHKFMIPGDALKANLSPDTAPGHLNRHQSPNTSKIFSMKPPDPTRPAI